MTALIRFDSIKVVINEYPLRYFRGGVEFGVIDVVVVPASGSMSQTKVYVNHLTVARAYSLD